MDKGSHKEIFAIKGGGVCTIESNVDLERFIKINGRIYSVKILVQAIKKDWFKCPGGAIECIGVELLFDSEICEFIGFEDVEDRDYFFMYFQRWLFDDKTFNVLDIIHCSKKEKNENN